MTVCATQFSCHYYHYTQLEVSHHGQRSPSSFQSPAIPTTTEPRRHPDRIHGRNERVQRVKFGVRLRHHLEHVPQHVSRDLVHSPQTQAYGSNLMIIPRYVPISPPCLPHSDHLTNIRRVCPHCSRNIGPVYRDRLEAGPRIAPSTGVPRH